MPIYSYRAKKGPSEIVEAEIEARSKDEAISKINEMGLAPISVVEKSVSQLASKPVSQLSPQTRKPAHPLTTFVRVRHKDIDTFTKQLSSMVKASVPILRALSLISEETENKTFKIVVEDLTNQVRAGKLISEAMSKYPRVFNGLYLSMVKTGEKGGALDEVLTRINLHHQKEDELRKKIQTALAYPLFVITVGIATVFIMLTFFLPKLITIFENMRQALPVSTKALIAISRFMSQPGHWPWFLVFFVFIFAIFTRVNPGSKRKFLLDIIKLHIPLVREFIKNAEIAKFARSLGLLLKNGVPIYESMELATQTLDNDALKKNLKGVGEEIVNQGSTLSDSLKKINIFPPFTINMIAVGEESGNLEDSLNEVAEVYEREVEQAIKLMTSILEPLLILIVGSIVGFIVFAMLMPVFNMGVIAR